MSNTTILFGVILIALGVGGYFATGAQSPTAMIPAVFGLLLVILGFLARKEHLRKHVMHGAAMVGLLGVLGASRGLLSLPAALAGEAERPGAVYAQSLMAVLCLVFVGLCVKSFIDARKAQKI